MQEVDSDPNKMWKVEEVSNTRGKGRNKQVFVEWKYYPRKFNSSIEATEPKPLCVCNARAKYLSLQISHFYFNLCSNFLLVSITQTRYIVKTKL